MVNQQGENAPWAFSLSRKRQCWPRICHRTKSKKEWRNMTKDKREKKTDDGWPELLWIITDVKDAGPFIASMGRASSIPSPGS